MLCALFWFDRVETVCYVKRLLLSHIWTSATAFPGSPCCASFNLPFPILITPLCRSACRSGIMSRPQGHRKSQSTSALNILAGSSSRHDLASLSRPSRRRQPTSGLPSVEESASMAQLPGLTDRSRRQSRVEIEAAGDVAQPTRRHSRRAVATMDDVRGWLNDVSQTSRACSS